MDGVNAQDLQLEESKAALAHASHESAAQETAEREEKLLAALSEAQSSLSNLQKLHEASQKQLFNLQTRDEEDRVIDLHNALALLVVPLLLQTRRTYSLRLTVWP